MTVEEYIEDKKLKPLTKKEILHKDNLKIRGTDQPMPWTEIYTRLSAGMSILDVIYIYGNARKIALFAQRDGITVNDILADTLDQEILQRRKMNEIESSNPEVARTMKEMVNEYAPDVARDVIMLSKKLVKKATDLVEEEQCTSNDLQNIAKAVQTMTDTIELTQRHSVGVNISTGDMVVEGFSIVADLPPKLDIIDCEDSKDT